MFFLSLFQSATTNENVPDVAPSNTAVQDEVGELAKQLQSGLVGPDNAGVAEQVSEINRQLQSALVGPTSSALLAQIAQLNNQVQSFYLSPPASTGVTSVDGSGGTTGLTLTGGPITSTGTLTLGGTLGTANGGTGSTSTTFVNLASNVTGVLPIANGGIGASSFASADLPTLSGSNTFSGVITTTGQNNQFTGLTYATTDGSGGVHAYFGENTSYAVIGGVNGVVLASGSTFPGTGRVAIDPNTMRPWSDNVLALGTSGSRYTVVYATTGTINTSDATEKQQVRELDDAERRTAQRIKGLIRAFKWNEAVESKGDGARIHFGVMAQDVEAAFAAEGLDATKYGLFCRDTWDTLDGQPQTRLGVRYEELLAFVIGSL
jgi:hypothetical protein